MALSTTALVTVQTVRDILGITATQASDEVLEGYIEAISGLFEQYTGRVLASRAFTNEELDGTGRVTLRLTADGKAAYPVTALTALTLKSHDLSASQVINVATTVNQVRLDKPTGRLTLYPDAAWSAFPLGHKNILVSFTAGFTAADHPAQRKALDRAALFGFQWLYQARTRDAAVSRVEVRGDGGISLTYGGDASMQVGESLLPRDLQAMLRPFVALRIV